MAKSSQKQPSTLEYASPMKKEKVTPLMQQYFQIREEYPDAILFFQVGDFYELFFDDAVKASAFLAIALTKRGKNQGEDVPLCGIPIHALGHYLRKLIKGGFKVAICDQLSKPQPGTVVKRGVTQVFTPGTLTDSLMLDDKTASYLMSFYPSKNGWGLLFGELLTAQLFATTLPAGAHKTVDAELARFVPDEVIIPETADGKPFHSHFKKRGYTASFAQKMPGEDGTSHVSQWLHNQFTAKTITQLSEHEAIMGSLETFYHFLKKNNEQALGQFKNIHFYAPEDYLLIDGATQKNLEIINNNHNGSSKNSLFFVLDKAKTAMGSRTVKKWLQRPLVQHDAIVQRQEVVAGLCNNLELMQKLEGVLAHIADLERIIGRIALERATVLDYLALKNSLGKLPEIKGLLYELALSGTRKTKKSKSPARPELVEGSRDNTEHTPVLLAHMINEKILDFSTLVDLLEASIFEPANSDQLIKEGFDHELDRLRNLLQNGQQEIAKLEQQEVSATGIGSLKVRYTNVSGYYIEVTNPNLKLVPEHYQHQQTLVNRKRFTTPQLKELEQALYKAQNELDSVQNSVYESVKKEVLTYLHSLRHMAQAVAYIDGLYAFASTAYSNQYVRPTITRDHHEIRITSGRHPVIETTLSAGAFVGNNTLLNQEQQLLIITGPNMGGKSTYLRQVALICLMAQCGSFVPADAAQLPLLDRIFTRIGSADNLAEGKSTFLVEMEETATICTQATKNSLVILDEVGRGTSTNDGIALAQAIIEHLLTQVQAKCLFATHYHELTQLESQFDGIKNFCMQCKKVGNTLHFMHTIAPGVAHKSFGLDVARLAQLPTSIIERANKLLNSQTALISENRKSIQRPLLSEAQTPSMPPQYTHVIDKIREQDSDDITPKQALSLLWELQKMLSLK